MPGIGLEDIGRLLVKVGGALILILGALGALKHVAALLLLYFFKGLLIAFLGSLIPGLPRIIGVLATTGYAKLLASSVANIVVAYLGYRLIKDSELAPMPAWVKTRWIIVLVALAVVSLLLGFTPIAITSAVPIAGLLMIPVKESTPRGSPAGPPPQAL